MFLNKKLYFIINIYVRNDLNPTLHNKTYSHLCDTFSNICECIFALFFLIGSFSGEIFYEHFQE